MMKSKIFLFLCALGLLFGCSKQDQPKHQKGSLLAPDYRAEEIHHIQIQTQYNTLNLRKAGDLWVIQEREDYPACSLSVANLLNTIGSIKIMDSIPVASEAKWGEFGLKDPSRHSDEKTGVRVRLSGSTGYQLDITLGNIIDSGSEASMHFGMDFDGHRYARLANESGAVLVNDSLSKTTTLLNFWIDDRFLKRTPVLVMEYFDGSNSQWKIFRDNAAAPLACIIRGETKELPNLTLMLNTLMATMQLDDILPEKPNTNLLNDFDRSFEITMQSGIRYRIHLGELVPIPEEEKVYLGQSTGMFAPVVFDSRRVLMLENLSGEPGAASLKTNIGIPYFKRTYLVNHPEFGKLFLNLNELVLFDQLMKEEVE